MKEYDVSVLFDKGYVLNMPKKLVQNDYNLIKLNLTFDIDGRVVFKLLYPDREKFIVDEVEDNSIIFKEGYLSQEGIYLIEFAIYDETGRLTNNAISEIEVRKELVSTNEIVEADDRVPILDGLINEVNEAMDRVENMQSGSGTGTGSGENGATFIPSVNEDGIITWTNDKGLENPSPINIKGPKGDIGEKGNSGKDGISVSSIIQTTTSSESGGTNIITATLSDGSTSTFNIMNGAKGDTGKQGLQGEPGTNGTNGIDGQSATITVGSVTTLEAGSNATVTNVGTETNAIFNFGIPKGENGTDGHTPVKGTDYYTEADKQEMIELVLASLPSAEEVSY